jgi:molybdate transport system substrate-binding protein
MIKPQPSGTIALALACVLVGACGRETPEPPARPPPAVAPVEPVNAEPKEELLVLAATSLTDAFKQLERAYEAKHPKVDVLLSFAGSSALALQIDQGGSGDVLATANEAHLQKLVKAGLIKDHAVFAHNDLVIAVAPGNPAKVTSFADLANAKRIVLGSPNVPIGQYADAVIKRAGEKLSTAIHAHVVSREANVRLVLAKVELGEADAAIVYRTDIRATECKPAPAGVPPSLKACGHAQAIELPAELSERATYPIGIPTRAKQPVLGRAFMEHVLSPEGQAVLAAHGFVPARPPSPAAEPKK